MRSQKKKLVFRRGGGLYYAVTSRATLRASYRKGREGRGVRALEGNKEGGRGLLGGFFYPLGLPVLRMYAIENCAGVALSPIIQKSYYCSHIFFDCSALAFG